MIAFNLFVKAQTNDTDLMALNRLDTSETDGDLDPSLLHKRDDRGPPENAEAYRCLIFGTVALTCET